MESSLKEFDDTVWDDDDLFETPWDVYKSLCGKYKVYPQLDVAADHYNKKCEQYIPDDRYGGALNNEIPEHQWTDDSWCNPPHSKTGDFVKKAFEQWKKHDINIIMIIPTNTMSSHFWHKYIEGHAEYHAIEGRIRFLKNGKPAKYKSRNAYVCVIWRSRQ